MGQTYEVEVSPGRTVILRELTAGEFESMYRAEGSGAHATWDLTQRGVRMSLVQDGDEPLTYPALVGEQLNQRFTTRELLLLRQAWESIHIPSAEDVARVRGMRAVATLGTSS